MCQLRSDDGLTAEDAEDAEENLSFQQFLNARFQFCGRGLRRVAFDYVALAIDEELGEVPANAAAEEAGLLVFEELVERVGGVAVDVDFAEDGEFDAIVQVTERFDVGVGAGLLMSELIAREAEDFESARVVLGVELLQTFVLRSESALAGGVHDEQDFALVVGERLRCGRC